MVDATWLDVASSMAAEPLTSTVSVTAPTLRTSGRSVVRPVSTTTPAATVVWKPGAVTLTSYVPPRRLGIK
jgi:hypothetical protein